MQRLPREQRVNIAFAGRDTCCREIGPGDYTLIQRKFLARAQERANGEIFVSRRSIAESGDSDGDFIFRRVCGCEYVCR